jgi:fumarate reductase flavoprotein subunit
MQHTVSRRGFLAGTAVAAGATAMASIARASESKGVDGKAASATVESAPSDWLGTAPTINPADVSETVECEVLVVGAGQSGSACASFAAAGGADTLWIEANANGNMMRSSAISGINTKYQKAVNVSINPRTS